MAFSWWLRSWNFKTSPHHYPSFWRKHRSTTHLMLVIVMKFHFISSFMYRIRKRTRVRIIWWQVIAIAHNDCNSTSIVDASLALRVKERKEAKGRKRIREVVDIDSSECNKICRHIAHFKLYIFSGWVDRVLMFGTQSINPWATSTVSSNFITLFIHARLLRGLVFFSLLLRLNSFTYLKIIACIMKPTKFIL